MIIEKLALYTAIIYFCSGTDCGLISTSNPIRSDEECRQELNKMEDQLRSNKEKTFTKIDGRCGRILLDYKEFKNDVCNVKT
jgi:hypothetical protein